MTRRRFATAVAAAVLAAAALHAQTRALPRAPDGKPDLSGIWNPPTGYLRNLAKDLKEDVPFQPWAKALYDERAAGKFWREEPDANCLPQGVPKVLLAPAPWQIVQTPFTPSKGAPPYSA